MSTGNTGKTEKTTITQELDAIIRDSAAAAKALDTLIAAYETHAQRGDNALSFLWDAQTNAIRAKRCIENYSGEAKSYKEQRAAYCSQAS